MAYLYKWAPGNDNEAGFVTLTYAPACKGLEYSEWIYSGNGLVFPKGKPFIRWAFTNLKVEWYLDLLDTIGLDYSVEDCYVETTISSRDYDRETYTNWNALTVHRKPLDTEYSMGVYRTVTFIHRNLRVT